VIARSGRPGPGRARWASVAIALLIVLALPAAAHGAGGRIKIRSRVTYADSVGVVVEVGALPHEECGARIRQGAREAEAPTVETGTAGGAKWSWFVPGNVGEGSWTFEAACGRGKDLERRRRTFVVGPGSGRHSKGLWIERSMHAEAFRLPASPDGNGGGGALYPVGQCTWWVARKRPDLPYFPGRSGDAMNWAESAVDDGFPTGATPVVGAVAVFAPGQYEAGRYGHVAYVTAVSGNEMTISEDNFSGSLKPSPRTIPFEGLRFIYRKGESTTTTEPPVHGTETPPIPTRELPPAKPTVELRGLIEDTPVAAQVPLSAASNAAGVRFSVYYFTELASPESARTLTIGEDRTPADGFTTSWDTTTVPNQGGPGGHTVMVTATALGADGEPDGVSSSVRVEVANSHTEGGVTYWPYYVVGTCEDGECKEGLHLRSGPGYSEYPTTGHRYDGEEVDVVCQEVGEPFTSPRSGEETEVWDQLTSGDWVIDCYVDTPNKGRFSAPLPRC
jgi:hypothetical protein